MKTFEMYYDTILGGIKRIEADRFDKINNEIMFFDDKNILVGVYSCKNMSYIKVVTILDDYQKLFDDIKILLYDLPKFGYRKLVKEIKEMIYNFEA